MRRLTYLALSMGLIGCSTSTHLYVTTDQETVALAEALGAASVCADLNLIDAYTYSSAVFAVADFLQYSSHNKELYSKTLADYPKTFAELRDGSIEATCESAKTVLPQVVTTYRYRTDQAKQAIVQRSNARWAAVSSTLSESAEVMDNSALAEQGRNPVYPTMPSSTPAPMSLPTNSDPVHIYRDGDFTSCVTTSSGVVMCN